jgi:RNA polymerase sigma-70 factor (ECF subfamily)
MAEHDQERLLELILAAQAGDEAAFEQLYTEFYEPILRFIAFRVPTGDDAEDLAQTVFMRFYNNLKNWRDQGYSPLAYVFTIARSVVADYYRKNRIKPVGNSEEILPLLMDTSAKPDELMQSNQEVERIMKSLGKLPQNYQEVISLRLIRELDYPQIAQMLNKTEVNVRKLYSRGIQKLQAQLTEDNK